MKTTFYKEPSIISILLSSLVLTVSHWNLYYSSDHFLKKQMFRSCVNFASLQILNGSAETLGQFILILGSMAQLSIKTLCLHNNKLTCGP